MDQAAPSNFYLTLCLYVSFYFLFFTTSLTIPTDQELNDQRRAKSYSEQLDPFLAATRQAQALHQAKSIAKARAKAFGSVRAYHSQQHSSSEGPHSRQRSYNRSSSSSHSFIPTSASTSTSHSPFASLTGAHSRQLSRHQRRRQKSRTSQQGHSSFYFYNTHDDPSNIPLPLTNSSKPTKSLDFRVLEHHRTREFTRLYHPQLHPPPPSFSQPYSDHATQEPFLAGYLSQRYRPLKFSRRFPRQNSNRYYHFYPESLFRTKSNVPHTETSSRGNMDTNTGIGATSSSSSSAGQSRNDGSRRPAEENHNNNNIQEAPSGSSSQGSQQQQHPQHRPGIGWADVAQLQQGDQIQARSLAQGQQEQDGIQQASSSHAQHGIGTASSVPGRYEATCHLEDAVSPPTLLAHLRLLRLVQSLVIVDDEDLDFLFLIRSEERYLMFLDLLQQVAPPANTVPLPPLDVALMWMVHMLAPFRYYEDLLKNYGSHLLNYAFPLERYVASVDIEKPTTNHEAFNASKEMWHKLYPEEAFDLDKNDTHRMFEIQCLWCGGLNVMDSSTYIKFRIDGMSIDCTGCGSQCSLETLSSKRFWDGIEAYRADSSVLLAGSLLSPWTGNPDPDAAQREHHHLFFHPRIQFGLDQANVALNCTWPKVIQTFQDLGPDQYYGVRPTTLARIISSYMGLVEDRLSMDLVAGALRQRDFQKAMMVTGGQAWCQPQVLERSLDRYKKFMFLARAESTHTAAVEGGGVAGMATMAAGGGTLGAGQPGRHALVPTLDIDLAWHTHMLSPLHYRQYQLIHYQRVLNHDDTVQATSSMTRQDFVRTAELWQNLYQEQYSSQQAWRSGIKWTPSRVCASIVFPPYGAYVVWRRWKVKRKSRKLNQGSAAAATAVADLEVQNVEDKKEKRKWRSLFTLFKRNKKNKGKEPATSRSDEVRTDTNANAGPGMQLDLRVEETVIREEDPQIEESFQQPTPSAGYDPKGKGKATSENDTAVTLPEASGSGSQPGATGAGNGSTGLTNRNVGLDGRLTNWNGDAAAPDGRALCSSGACIMSPWNELQDLVPYADLQPQQQRELRRERT